jgi:hypothetical protein
MPVFLERFVLPVLAGSIIAIIVLNPFKLDWQQRLSLAVGVLALAYFVGHTIHKGKTGTGQVAGPAAQTPAKSGDAKTSGDESPAVTGNGNDVKYEDSSHSERKSEPPKKE